MSDPRHAIVDWITTTYNVVNTGDCGHTGLQWYWYGSDAVNISVVGPDDHYRDLMQLSFQGTRVLVYLYGATAVDMSMPDSLERLAQIIQPHLGPYGPTARPSGA